MKKLLDSVAGLIAGLAVVLIINGLLQGLAVSVILGQPIRYSFHGIKLDAEFLIDPLQFWSSLFVIITPVIASIIFIEVVIVSLAARGSEKYSILMIVFQTVITGFLLVYTLTGIISVLIKNSVSNDFVNLLQASGYSHNKQLMFMLMFAFFLFGYINIILKRMRKNLPAVIENKTGNIDDSKK